MDNSPAVEDIIDVMKSKSYRVLQNRKGYDLNIVGIRSSVIDQEVFNDWLVVFYMQDRSWNSFSYTLLEEQDFQS